MPGLKWYWHRLLAMGPVEIALRLRKKWFELSDSNPRQWPQLEFSASSYPVLPSCDEAPGRLLEAIKNDAERIASGKLRFYGHLDVTVDSPPIWHRDYQAGVDVPTDKISFKLDHRQLPSGAAIKPLWEPSRWYGAVRLAQACWLLSESKYGAQALEWLEDWVKKNPAYFGWHWTSALESGMRLIAFTWIDAFITAHKGESSKDLERRLVLLRKEVLLPHVWFTWRHRSFGSSANNHLLGELSGLVLAISRWPDLEKIGPSLTKLSSLIERETLIQFNPDGGNFEQGLNYHYYSWEFSWEAFHALDTVGALSSKQRACIEERLGLAAFYYKEVQVPSAPWDYGDSDGAYVMPWFLDERMASSEWYQWLIGQSGDASFYYFMRGQFIESIQMPDFVQEYNGWKVFAETGFLVKENGGWKARVDVSPLGSGSMAAHGHLDAQQISLWFNDAAIVIDPGTGDYHGNPLLRNWLASRDAHNGPSSNSVDLALREGLFLWRDIHSRPLWTFNGDILEMEVRIDGGALSRTIEPLKGNNQGWFIRDSCEEKIGRLGEFSVRWQFAPNCRIEQIGKLSFRIVSNLTNITIEIGEGWSDIELYEPDLGKPNDEFGGIVSPCFMKTTRAPYIKLYAKPIDNSEFTTVFKTE